MRKKLVAVFLCLTMGMGTLTGCGSENAGNDENAASAGNTTDGGSEKVQLLPEDDGSED